MSTYTRSTPIRRRPADYAWTAVGIALAGLALIMLLTLFGPLGTFGRSDKRPPAPTQTTFVPQSGGTVDLGNGAVCHQCMPAG
jgi:hypothetical protein